MLYFSLIMSYRNTFQSFHDHLGDNLHDNVAQTYGYKVFKGARVLVLRDQGYEGGVNFSWVFMVVENSKG